MQRSAFIERLSSRVYKCSGTATLQTLDSSDVCKTSILTNDVFEWQVRERSPLETVFLPLSSSFSSFFFYMLSFTLPIFSNVPLIDTCFVFLLVGLLFVRLPALTNSERWHITTAKECVQLYCLPNRTINWVNTSFTWKWAKWSCVWRFVDV